MDDPWLMNLEVMSQTFYAHTHKLFLSLSLSHTHTQRGGWTEAEAAVTAEAAEF